MKVLLTSATGYLGRRLKNRLLEEDNVRLRLLVRDARHVSESTRLKVETVEGDIRDKEAARRAVEGVDVVYYPIRFLGALWEPEFDSSSVQSFRDVCIEAGVRRLVYVGLNVSEATPIKLLRNVIESGEILSACPEKIQTVWLRAGVLLGSGSVIFELLRNIVQKIPIIIAPPWMDAKISPLGVADVVEYLARVKDLEAKENLRIDIGSEQRSFKEMLKESADVMGLRRVFVSLPFTARRLSSFLLMLATPFSYGLSSVFIQAMQSGALSPARTADGAAAKRYFPGITPLPFRDALQRAILEIEKDQVTSRWVDTLGDFFYVSSEEDIARAVYRDVRSMCFGDLPPFKIFRAVKSIGGRRGWFTFDFLWRIRGFLDKLAGGYGTAMGRRAASDLRVGDLLDVWKVVDLKEGERLLLEAQMKVFGKAWLEFKIEGDRLIQTAYHYPKGLLGRVYWFSMFPFHAFIFRDMIRNIIREARKMP
jgi:uncharacterized protein YbjT (DUF2867 family)